MAQSTCILLVYTYWYKPRLLLPLTHLCTHLVYPFLITFNAEYIKKRTCYTFYCAVLIASKLTVVCGFSLVSAKGAAVEWAEIGVEVV